MVMSKYHVKYYLDLSQIEFVVITSKIFVNPSTILVITTNPAVQYGIPIPVVKIIIEFGGFLEFLFDL